MKTEWDPLKRNENLRRHHLDFEDGFEVFDGPMFTQIDDRFDYSEIRIKGIGFLSDIVVVIVFTELSDDTIRIISFRKAIKYEREQFYKHLQDELGTSENDA